MAPVGGSQWTGAFMRAGRGNMRAGRDQLLAQRKDGGVADGGAGLDDQQRVPGPGPHQLGERMSFRHAGLADHVACHHQIGRPGLGQRGAGVAVPVCQPAQARMGRAELERQRTQGGIAVDQGKTLQRGKGVSRGPTRGPRPGADIEQARRRKTGPAFAQRIQACRHRGIGCRHPRQRIGERIALGPDRAEPPPAR